MNNIKKVLLGITLVIIILSITSCEELFTTIKGTVENDGNPVSEAFVLALNGTGDAYERLGDINELDESALSAISGVVKGFDLASDSDGAYSATLLSGGTVYIVAISDENDNDELDPLDLVGWYGDVDSINIIDTIIEGVDTTIIDTTFQYNTPKTVTVETGEDITGIDIDRLLEYKWLLKIQEQL